MTLSEISLVRPSVLGIVRPTAGGDSSLPRERHAVRYDPSYLAEVRDVLLPDRTDLLPPPGNHQLGGAAAALRGRSGARLRFRGLRA